MSPSASPSAKPHPPPEDCEYSVPTWKRVPSVWDVLFSLRLPYRAPENRLAAYLWRKRIWFESTFALTMMEPWEKLVLVLILTTLSVLFSIGLLVYFPVHLSIILSRAKYYLSGTELPNNGPGSSSSTLDDGSGGFGILEAVYAAIVTVTEKLKTWHGPSSAGGEL
ncbi:hypothetical protein BC835DRAFT_1308258 [Cytidiella melzeri]|nr:hypothetical protein BC835DRAFT_1308258 [Cytidiella melzeri]